MKAINKNLSLATAYKKWVDELDASNKPHPEYNSSGGKYYYDIIANLLWVQNGLCAYTEMYLADPEKFNPDKWKEGRFEPFKTLGQLDHYDSTLKKNKGWDWSNFFMIHSDVNMKQKRDRKVNYLLKPDKPGFLAAQHLQYDIDVHFFVPNIEGKNQEEIDFIRGEIDALGLNFEPIVDYRKKRLAPLFNRINFGRITTEEARNNLDCIPTAFEMGILQINK